jgi:ABC-type phosphate transport system auxiliary subunit
MICSSASALADEPQAKPSTVEKRLLKIDLNIAFKQYKRIKTQLEDLRLQERSPQANEQQEKQKKLMSQQEDYLTMACDELRSRILELGKKLEQMDSAKKAK